MNKEYRMKEPYQKDNVVRELPTPMQAMGIQLPQQLRVKVTEMDIIVTRLGEKRRPYFEIKYKEVGKPYYSIGYGSYSLKCVFEWYDECFEIVKDVVNAKP